MADDAWIRAVADDIDRRLDADVDVTVTRETEALYGGMHTAALLTFREAFRLDRDRPGTSEVTRAFCDGRLALIERLLAARSS